MDQEELEDIIQQTVDIPSLPIVATKVMQLIGDDFSSINELERIISMDQSFSSRILKIANSAYYGRYRHIDTVSAGIMLIGFNTMKSLVVAASLKDINRKFGLFEQRQWEHSLGVSLAASLLAKETRVMPAEEALVAGLMHDIGKTVLNNNVPERYSLIIERVYEEGLTFIEVENDMLGFSHCDVGGLIARKWKLPANLESVIRYHHAKDFPSFEDNSYETHCQIVNIADTICINLGIGFRKPLEISPLDIEFLGISEKRFEELEETFKKMYSEQKTDLLS